jgi:hypothetical protein
MKKISKNEIKNLLRPAAGPCISIYIKGGNETKRTMDKKVLAIKLDKARGWLKEKYPEIHAENFLQPLRDWIQSNDASVYDGVACFYSDHFSGFMPTTESHATKIVLADSFHIRPILARIQAQDSFLAVAISKVGIDLFLGDDVSLQRVEHMAIPAHLKSWSHCAEILSETLSGGKLTPVASHRWGDVDRVGMSAFLEQFYKRLRAWQKTVSYPVILFAPDEMLALCRDLSGADIAGYFSTSEAQLKDQQYILTAGQAFVENNMEKKYKHAVGKFLGMHRIGLATSKLSKLIDLANKGSVQQLLVNRKKHLWKHDNPIHQTIKEPALVGLATDDDLIDDISEEVLRHGGEVLAGELEFHPNSSGMLAILKSAGS